MKFVRTIRDPARRKFAHDYAEWLGAGRVGIVPDRGRLSTDAARLMVLQIEAIG